MTTKSHAVTRKKAQKRLPAARSNMTLWLIGAVAISLVVLAVWASTRQSTTVVNVPEAQAAYADIPPAWINGKTLGNPDASVTIQAWEDFM